MTTLSQSTADKLEREILTELQDDYVGLWEVTRLVAEELDTADVDSIRDIAESVLRNMLMSGLISPGFATDEGGFEPWSLDPGRAALRISEELRDLGRLPSLGEVAWFNLTRWGERVAAQS